MNPNAYDHLPREHQSPATKWLAAINAAYPDRPVSLRTVYHWIQTGTAPEWALKLRSK